MLSIMSERTSDIDEVVCACFTDWQASDRETGAINAGPEEQGIDWHERKLTWIRVLKGDLTKQTQEV